MGFRLVAGVSLLTLALAPVALAGQKGKGSADAPTYKTRFERFVAFQDPKADVRQDVRQGDVRQQKGDVRQEAPKADVRQGDVRQEAPKADVRQSDVKQMEPKADVRQMEPKADVRQGDVRQNDVKQK